MTNIVPKPFNYLDIVRQDIRFENLTLPANDALDLSRTVTKDGYMAVGVVGQRSTINTLYFSRFRVKTPQSGIMPIGEADLELVLANPDSVAHANVVALVSVLWVKVNG